jgi:threonine/homoserine/homoserine lactone efflux protein
MPDNSFQWMLAGAVEFAHWSAQDPPMIDASWFVFVAASLVLIATPGQDMILVMSRSVAQGAAAGVVTAGGVSLGLVGHTVLATLGLGAVLRTSEWLFIALKLVGAAYLIHLGIGLLRTKQSTLPIGPRAARSLRKLFVDGAVSNPKIAVFYFAFLPQFVSPSAQYPTLTVLVLGLAFAGLTFLVKAPVGIFAGRLSTWLRSRPGVLTWVFRSSGAILVALGARLALERR